MKRVFAVVLGVLVLGAIFSFALHDSQRAPVCSDTFNTLLDCLAPTIACADSDTISGPFNPPPPPPPPID